MQDPGPFLPGSHKGDYGTLKSKQAGSVGREGKGGVNPTPESVQRP